MYISHYFRLAKIYKISIILYNKNLIRRSINGNRNKNGLATVLISGGGSMATVGRTAAQASGLSRG